MDQTRKDTSKYKQIPASVWNAVMNQGFDFVFRIHVPDGIMSFAHACESGALVDYRRSFDPYAEAPDFSDFCKMMLDRTVDEEKDPFRDQTRLEYIRREVADRGDYVRTVHIIVDGERKSVNIRIFPDPSDPEMLIGIMFDVSAFLDHDWMTDEYARIGFVKKIRDFLKEKPEDRNVSLVYTNVKGFKAINDLFGEQSGDMVIFHTRDRLREILDPIFIGRPEGDHFILLVNDESLTEENFNILGAQTYSEGDRQYDFSIRAGIYHVTSRDVPIRKMIDRARLAERSLSETSVRTYMIYDDKVRASYINRQKYSSEMSSALESNEFKAYFQPIVNAADHSVASAEALIRWQHKDIGMISPGEFIPAFESSGQISALDRFMIDRVTDLNGRRKAAGSPLITCAVNLSRIDFYNNSLMDHLLSIYEKDHSATDWLRVEVTESAYADLENNASDYLEKLKSLGVKILLDDFGSGMSSLSTLENFDFDIVKLDMGFIRKIGIIDKAEMIIKSTIDLSHALGAKVTAEGVETKEQLDFLSRAGCDYIQGYYFYKPVPEDELEKILDREI
ncbi:MAG: EAL domain-containing protein [Lachnospiraceae bacterium]|nr:EAL domain-containing protein [Lachnospiraceae bacterium]